MISGYRIQMSVPSSGYFSTVVSNTGTDATSYTITGLSNGTSYVFRVAAINSAGVGPNSGSSSSVTPVAANSEDAYAAACDGLAYNIYCSKYFTGIFNNSGYVDAYIPNNRVLSVPLRLDTASEPSRFRFTTNFSSSEDQGYYFDAWLSNTANGAALPGEYCSRSALIAEAILFIKSRSGGGVGCALPARDGLVWLNFKYWNPSTGDLGVYYFFLSQD